MQHAERLELIKVIKDLLPAIRHTRWPSGLCSDDCKGCDLVRSVERVLGVLEKDFKEFADAITKMRLAGNIKSENPEVVMSVVLSILYKDSKIIR